MAVVESLLVALPLFLLGVVVFEVSQWAVARQAVTYALFEAARTGAVTGADRHAVHLALERALTPLLGDGHTDLTAGHEAVRTRLATFHARWGIKAYRLQRPRPDPDTLQAPPAPDILVLDLTYLHAPLFPGVRQVVQQWITSKDDDPYVSAARHAGLVVIRRDMAMPMQTRQGERQWDRGKSNAGGWYEERQTAEDDLERRGQ